MQVFKRARNDMHGAGVLSGFPRTGNGTNVTSGESGLERADGGHSINQSVVPLASV
jgi:hypothetical protein